MIELFNTALALMSAHWVIPIVLMLGVFSITRLISVDTFPPIEKIRNWIFDRFPPDGHTSARRPTRGKWVLASNGIHHVTVGTWLGELISCMWCAGWWVSLATSMFFLYWPVATTMVLFPFALMVIPGIINQWLGH